MTGRAWLGVALIALCASATAALWLRCEGDGPSLRGPQQLLLGQRGAQLEIAARDPGSGLRLIRVLLIQGNRQQILAERDLPGNLLVGGAAGRDAAEALALQLEPGARGLQEGEALLRVEAVDWSWAHGLAGNRSQLEVPVRVDLSPPRLAVESGLTYVRRGGAALVVYRVGEPVAGDGVRVGDRLYPGHPFPGSEDPALRVALFAVPRDAPAPVRLRVWAEDRAGNPSETGWPARLQERSFEEVRISLSPRFLEGRVRSLARHLGVDAGDPVAAFQKINRDVRRQNEQRIQEIVSRSSDRPLWQGAFLQLRGSAVTSRFAERRHYLWKGEPISEAIHYGTDLASTAGAAVQAANAGRVLFAGDLGIYGGCVILDHGLGVATLYGHLSRIDVKVGERVERGAELGRTGATGLAGGDHLHYAVLVGGTYVDPREWWDPRWVQSHVEARLRR